MHDDKDASLTRRKIDDLNAAAFELRVRNSNRAFELSDEALAMAEEADYARGKAEALRTKGFCYMRLSKNAEAQTCCEESFRLYETLQDLRGQGYLYTGFGIIQRNTGNYKAALELFYKSLELLQLTQYHE
jgi:tetratricopeptide (TPR) repeat protein